MSYNYRTKEILNQDSGLKAVLKTFIQSDIPFRIKSVNKSRHKHIITKIGDFYFIYKREYFHTFGKQFNLGNQEGESINKDSLDYCLRNKIKLIIFVHPKEIKCYSAYAFHKIAEKNQWLRLQDKKNYYREGVKKEITYSIPKDYLINFKISLINRYKAGEIEI